MGVAKDVVGKSNHGLDVCKRKRLMGGDGEVEEDRNGNEGHEERGREAKLETETACWRLRGAEEAVIKKKLRLSRAQVL